LVIGAKSRMGRVRVAVRRCLILSDDRPILVRDVLQRCYPRVRKYRSRQYELARAALRRVAICVGCQLHARGRPRLWMSKSDYFGANSVPEIKEN